MTVTAEDKDKNQEPEKQEPEQEEEVEVLDVDKMDVGVPVATATPVDTNKKNILTVTVNKSSPHVSVGVALKGDSPEILFSVIKSEGLLGKTEIEPGMILQSINGQSFEKAKDAAIYLKESSGNLTFVVHKNILEATIYKSSIDTPVGVSFKGSTPPIIIANIAPNSPLMGSEIMQGMTLVRINGNSFSGSKQAAMFLREIEGKITIEARRNYEKGKAATTTAGQKPPPPGCKPGGVWKRENYHGPTTCVMTLLGCFLFGIFGLVPLCVPCDEHTVYVVVS